MRRIIIAVSGLSSLLLLGACDLRLNEHVMEARERSTYDFRKGNRVDLVQFNHQVAFKGNAVVPSDAQLDKLDAFLKRINLGYGDQVALQGSTPARRGALEVYLQRQGLPIQIASIAGSGAQPTSDSVKIVVERHVVTPPQCPNWSNFDGDNERNTPGSHFGCSVDSSLGYMIANPKDLVEGQAIGPALGIPSIEAQRRYETNKVKTPKAGGF